MPSADPLESVGLGSEEPPSSRAWRCPPLRTWENRLHSVGTTDPPGHCGGLPGRRGEPGVPAAPRGHPGCSTRSSGRTSLRRRRVKPSRPSRRGRSGRGRRHLPNAPTTATAAWCANTSQRLAHAVVRQVGRDSSCCSSEGTEESCCSFLAVSAAVVRTQSSSNLGGNTSNRVLTMAVLTMAVLA